LYSIIGIVELKMCRSEPVNSSYVIKGRAIKFPICRISPAPAA
jgi:hypothetical protein